MRTSFVTLFAALAAASPLLRRDDEPCDLVAQQVAGQTKGPYRVDPHNALACLQSVPVDKENNLASIQTFRSFAEIESNLAYLKHPTPGTLYPATDILGRLDKIIEDLGNDVYENEYDLQFDVWAVASDAYDYHFNYDIDIIHVFYWRRAEQLISVSPDGVSLPSIYLYSDLGNIGNSTGSASPVSTINGIDVETYLNDYAALLPYGHDPDANYNAALLSIPATNTGKGNPKGTFAGGARPQLETVVKFANGTTYEIDTYATTWKSFDGVDDGASFFAKFCKSADVDSDINVPDEFLPGNDTTEEDAPPLNPFNALTTNGASKPLTSFFPTALVATDDRSMFGYLPDDIPDLAVLQMGSFGPANNLTAQFQNNVRSLLATAQARNKTKLLIDLRGNGGGKIFLGYDTFRQIFPTIYPYGGSTLRSPPLLQETTDSISEYIKATPDRSEWSSNVNYSRTTAFNAYAFLDTNNNRFTSSETFYGPYFYYNDNFTAVERHDLATAAQTSPVDIYGYGNNTESIPQVFKPENIIILQDGMCGSTCAIFSEFMKSQGNVKTIVAGGRKQYGTMQGVGGTKGSQVIGMDYFGTIVATAEEVVDAANNKTLTAAVADFNEGYYTLAARTNDGEGVRINFRNQVRQGDASKTALQYVYEAANCRFFYTPSMLRKQVSVWQRVYDLQWGNATCVKGSDNHPSAQTGNGTSYINSPAPDYAKYSPKGSGSKSSASAKPSSARSSRTRSASSAIATGASKSRSVAKSSSTSSKTGPAPGGKSSSTTSTTCTETKSSVTSSTKSSSPSPYGKSSSTSSATSTTCTETKSSVTSSSSSKSSSTSSATTTTCTETKTSTKSSTTCTICTETKTSSTSSTTSKTTIPPYNGPSSSTSTTSKSTVPPYNGPSSSTTTITISSMTSSTSSKTSPPPYGGPSSSTTTISSATTTATDKKSSSYGGQSTPATSVSTASTSTSTAITSNGGSPTPPVIGSGSKTSSKPTGTGYVPSSTSSSPAKYSGAANKANVAAGAIVLAAGAFMAL